MNFTNIVDSEGRHITVNAAQITHVMPLVNGCRVHLAGGQTIQCDAQATELGKQLIDLNKRTQTAG